MKDEKEATGIHSAFRASLGRWVAICFSVFVIYALATLAVQELQMLSIFLSFTLALAFIHYPLNPQKPGSKLFMVIDLILAALSFVLAVYICVDYWDFIFRVGIPTTWDIVLSIVAILLVFEATRRTLGWALVIIAGVFLLYTFFGQFLPAPLSHDERSIVNSCFVLLKYALLTMVCIV